MNIFLKMIRGAVCCCLTAALVLNQSPLSAEAADIRKISLKVSGTIAPGDFVSESLPEVETLSDRYYVDSFYFCNGTVAWDRRDTPRLVVLLYPTADEGFSSAALEDITVRGMAGTLAGYEWTRTDEEDGVGGLCLYLDLPALSTPGASALARRAELEAEYASWKSKKRAKAALEQMVADGWYQDCNGWWYLDPDGNYPVSQWRELDGNKYYLNADGYLVTGWFQVNEVWYYANADGSLLTDGVTPDGYTVNADGMWIPG